MRRAGLLLGPSTAYDFFELSIPARSTSVSLPERSPPVDDIFFTCRQKSAKL